jgi:hypothetical protein
VAGVAILAPVMLGHSVAIPDELLGAAIMVPCQWPGARCQRAVGARALLLRLLADALHQADLGPRVLRKGSAPRTGPGRVTRAQVVVARRWLLGELDAEVALPVGVRVRRSRDRSRRARGRRAGSRRAVICRGT